MNSPGDSLCEHQEVLDDGRCIECGEQVVLTGRVEISDGSV